jgi:sec-independent protein translocase protein TatA
MFGIGAQELMIIFLIVLLLFGANRIPEIARALGKGIRDFKRATRDIDDEVRFNDDDRRRIGDRPSQAHSAPEGTTTRSTHEKTS